LDDQLEGKQFICGDRFSLADIMLYCFLKFGIKVGQPLNANNRNVTNLFNQLDSRGSAKA
jgi:glutathione S-transferase